MDNNSENLRAQAKEELRQGKIIDTSLYETDMKVLVEELSIYQIELEHQNQELMLSHDHLQQSNNRYLDLFDNAPVGYLIVDSTGIIKDINQTACVLFENSKTQFVDTKISKLIHPDYQDIYFLYFRTLIHQKLNQPCDIKLRKANNSFFYGRIQGVCQTSEIDSDPEFRLAISDISTQKEMEFKLLAAKEQTEQSEMQHRTILQTAMDGYWLVDLDGKFLEVNDAYCSMSGYTKTELLKMHISDFEVIEDVEKTEYHIKKVIVNGSDRFESKHRRKDGSVYDVEISTIYQNEYKNAFVVFIRDISEQKLAENALLEAEWKFKALFDLGPIGVAYHRMIYDEAGKPIDYYFVDANASYNELTGVNPKGMTVREAFPGIENDPADWIGVFGKVAKTSETIRFEQFLESNGRWYDCVAYQYKPDHFVAAFNEITKRKEAEIALKESEERFSLVIDASEQGIWDWNVETNEVFFSEQWKKQIGYNDYELKNDFDTWIEHLHPDEAEYCQKAVNSYLNEPVAHFVLEFRFRHKDGTYRWIHNKAASLKNNEGKVIRMFGSHTDITEQKQVQELLRQSEERNKAIVLSTPDHIIMQDKDLKYTFVVNPQMGLEEQDMLGKTDYDFLTKEDAYNLTITKKQVLKSGEPLHFETSLISSSGKKEFFDGSYIPIIDDRPEVNGLIGYFKNVTERKQAEIALKESEIRFKILFDDAPDAMLLADPETGKIIDANNKACRLFKRQKHELIDLYQYELHPPKNEDISKQTFKEQFENTNIIQSNEPIENKICCSDGTEIPVEIIGQAIHLNGQSLMLGTFRDITERKKAEEALKQSEEKFAVSFKTSPYAITITRPEDGKFIEVNDAFFSITGYSPEEALNSTSIGMDLWLDAEDRNNVLKVLRTGGTINGQEFHLKKKNGEIITGLFSAQLIDIKNKTYILSSINDISEQYKAEQALRENEKKFRSFFENSVVGKSITTIEGNLSVNNSFCKIVGYSEAELNTLNWKEITHADDIELNVNIISSILKGEKQSERWEKRYIHKDGHIVWVDISTTLHRDGNGNPLYFITAIFDITERKQAELLLENERALYLDLVNTQPAGIYRIRVFPKTSWEVDAWTKADTSPYKMELISDRFCEILEISPEKFESQPGLVIDLVHPDDKEEFARRNEEANTLVSVFSWDCRLLINNNIKWIHFESLPRKLENGDILFTGIIYDITEQKQAEEALIENNLRLELAMQASKMAWWEMEMPSGNIVFNNRKAEMLGYSPEKFKHYSDFMSLVHPEDAEKVMDAMRNHMYGTVKAYETEYRILTNSGEYKWFYDIGSVVERDATEKPLKISGLVLDITERKQAEEALRKSEERYSSLLQYLETGIVVHAPDSAILTSNPRASELLGLTFEQMQGKVAIDPDWNFVNVDNSKLLVENYPVQQIINTKQAIKDQIFGIQKTTNHTIIWVNVNGFPVLDTNGEITEIVISFNDITERKHAEELFIDIVDKNPMSIQIVDKEGHTLQTNPAFSALFGAIPPPDYSIFDDLISKGPELEKLIQLTISGEVVHLPDIYYNVHDLLPEAPNNPHWIRALIFPLKDSTGKPERFVIMHEDITERKNAEDALRESEEKFKKAFIVSPDSININRLDDGMYVSINKGFTRIMGYTEDEIIGKTSKEMNIWVDFNNRIKLIEGLKQYGFVENLVAEFKNKNGKSVTGMMSAIVIELNGEKNILSITRDVTELKKAEKALRESEEKLSTLFNSMTEMVVMHELVFDENGDAINYRILDCNKTFTSITGIEKESAVGRLATEVYGIETAPYLQEYANVALNGSSLEFNTYYLPLDKYFLISAVSSGKNRFSTISTDITSNEQIHEIIKEKNKELENYIYVASHDLRSPLVNIQGFSKRLQKQTAELTNLMAEMNANAELAAEYKRLTTDDIPKSLSFILNNVSKMDTLINGLLQVSRTGRVVMSPAILEMNKLFKSILTIFDYQLKEMEANVVLHELDSCYGDTNQLNQLFSNIIGNALKYSDKNRKLTLEISSHTKYNKVTYSIKDNGIGINNRHLQKIWDVFYRVDASAPEAGEGLGLSLAKRIVDKHKGKIWAESVEGEGSTFFVELHKNKFEE